MSLRQLVEGDCGGVNPLMQLGGQFTRDAARRDEGLRTSHFEQGSNNTEFLGHAAAPPQSFHMGALLQEMREIENTKAGMSQSQSTPHAFTNMSEKLVNDLSKQSPAMPFHVQPPTMIHVDPQHLQVQHVREFFDNSMESTTAYPATQNQMQPFGRSFIRPMPYMASMAVPQPLQPPVDKFFEEAMEISKSEEVQPITDVENWLNSYQVSGEENEQTNSSYNEKFWQRLQDEWQKLSEDNEYPWLSEYNETYDPYKEYKFSDENPMLQLEDPLAKGKEYLAEGDIPSAVLCFEAAAKKEPENANVWELLGISQAENEMDPQAIAALKHSLEINPDNPRVLMALAVCYTNESLQSHAIKMLTNWLRINPKYKYLVENKEEQTEIEAMASSLVGNNKVIEVQELFQEAARQEPFEIDSDVQEALGVLYNLSAEFDKAADCFRLALQKNPQNAKIWNRLGASLANGSRSNEAVEAYQKALTLEPGFIRVRYNVGVCCMNLKAYRQAAEHLLMALTMQANTMAQHEHLFGATAAHTSQRQMSDSIWNTLKMIISLMGRSELHSLVNERNLDALNQAFKQ